MTKPMHEFRLCAICSQSFQVGSPSQGGRWKYCSRECQVAARKARILEHNKANGRRYARKYKYGITEEEVNRLLELQNYECKICSTSLAGGRDRVDHDHKSGRVRGLLCDECNHGLGNFKDDIVLLGLAYEYLTAVQNL